MVSGNSNEDIERGENICYCSNQVGYKMLERGRYNKTTHDKLMKSKWNSNEHQQGTWREDLQHMAKTAGNL